MRVNRLVLRQKRFWIPTLAGQLEGSEILPPGTFRDFRIAADPSLQSLQAVLGDLTVVKPFDEMLLDAEGKRVPVDPRHLLYSPKTSRTN